MTITRTWARYRVRCRCGWKGVRTRGECECYDMPCHPAAPGAGCGAGVVWPCPRCGAKPWLVGRVGGLRERHHAKTEATGVAT